MEDSSETPLEKCQRLGLTIYSVTASESATTATAIDVATAIADQKRISAPIDAGEESNPAHLVLDREPRDETTITDRDHLPISPPIRPTETCIPTNLKPDKEVGCEIIRSEESLTPAAHELQQPRVPASITDVTGLVPDKHLKNATAFLDTKPLPAAQLIAPPHRSTPIIKSRVTSRNKETAIEKSIRLGTPVFWKEIHFEKWGTELLRLHHKNDKYRCIEGPHIFSPGSKLVLDSLCCGCLSRRPPEEVFPPAASMPSPVL